MSHLPPLPRFRFDQAAAVAAPFEGLADAFRRAPVSVQAELDACVAMDDGAGAVVSLSRLFLSLEGGEPTPEAIRQVLPLRDVAKARRA